jgi:DNA (cytosine-5)-methyltransferase 1
MRHGSLFSGIGGFDLASEWMGWENVFHCEWNPFGQKVLNHYWPKAITYHDITKTDFTIHRGEIDIITGGFPCQPYSSAGKRLGKEDERHLWPQMLRAIREIQPTWVVGENVRGLTNWNGGLVFDEVQAELEAQGYEVTPFLLPACAVNAPHRRDRIWFVAYNATNANLFRFDKCIQYDEVNTSEGGINALSDINKGDVNGNATNSNGIGCDNRGDNWQERHICSDEGFAEENKSEWNRRKRGTREISSNATDSQSERLQGMHQARRKDINNRENTEIRRDLTGYDKKNKWTNFPTVSPICDGDDGLSDRLDGITFSKWRNESIKAGGNAIVPQVVHQIFKAIEQYETIRQA